jgi:hypothetical protein
MVTVLFLGAAVSFATFARSQIRRASDEEFALRARSLAVIACGFVSELIAGDNNGYDSPREVFYSPEAVLLLPFGDWEVNIGIMPQDALIPINTPFLPDGVTVRQEYEHLWSQVWTLLGASNAGVLALDFLDADVEPRVGSREDGYFPNKKISDMSEFLRLPEIEPELLYGSSSDLGLNNFFTVRGEESINVNVAPREVLAVLDPDLGPDAADAIIVYREDNDIKSASDLNKIPGLSPAAVARLDKILTGGSNYFLVRIGVRYENNERNFVILLKRGGAKCQVVNWRE